MYSSPPLIQALMILVRWWARDGALCLEHLFGSAATVAWFNHRGHESTGFGLNPDTASLYVYSDTIEKEKIIFINGWRKKSI